LFVSAGETRVIETRLAGGLQTYDSDQFADAICIKNRRRF